MLKFVAGVMLLMSAAVVCAGAEVKFVQTDEFVGPLAGWRDVKRDYGAKGDGVTDDTAAINKALAELKKTGREFTVLYFPTGVYRVTSTLTTSPCKAHSEGTGITVIGEDPATTVIKWDGQDKGTVFSYTAWYSKISRLTLDGSGRAGIGLLFNGEKFSTWNETSDMVFKDSAIGVQLGGKGGDFGQAENMVHRCRFTNCGKGLVTASFNSLDIWVWNSLFEDCGVSLHNAAGDFRAYSCVFLRSRKCDITSGNLSSFSFVDNVSIGSAMFLDFSGAPVAVFGRAPNSICWNRIYDCTGDKGAIRLGGGPSLVWGNTFRSRADDKGPAVLLGADQGLFDNTYTVPTPVGILTSVNLHDTVYRPRVANNREVIVKREDIADPKPVMPGIPARVTRKVFEVEPGSDAATIQAAIDAATALKTGTRPVVHLRKGVYRVDKTLLVPDGTDLQIIGDGADGNGTALVWTGAKGEFLMRVEGAGQSCVNDLFIKSSGNGIAFENCDRAGGCFYADRLYNTGPNTGTAAVWVDGMDKSRVQFRCMSWDKGRLRVNGAKGALDAGPTKPANTIQAVTSVFCGCPGESNDKVFDISDRGTAILSGIYYDAGRVMPIISMSGNGNIFYDAGICAAGTSADFPMLGFRDFSGRALFTVDDMVECAGSNSGPRVRLEGDCSKASVILFGTDLQAKSNHGMKDLYHNDSVPKCMRAGAYCSIFESPALPNQFVRPNDITFGGPAAEQPAAVIMGSLDFFKDGARPRTPGIDNNERLRIHNVNVNVNGDIGVLIRGGK